MNHSLSKLFVIAAMLIAFIGQAIAYDAMTCDMTDMHTLVKQTSVEQELTQAVDHSAMNHNAMNHSAMGHQMAMQHAMPKQMSQQTPEQMSHQATSAKASMHISTVNDTMNSSDDCCDTDCPCPTNACSSVTLLTNNLATVNTDSYSEAIRLYRSAQPQLLLTSLYRPPIFA